MNVLRLNSRGPEVERLQALLNTVLRLSPPLRVDGWFGMSTDRAVRRFQATRGLREDGIVGARTWAALGVGSAAPPVRPAARPPVVQPAAADTADAPWMRIARDEMGTTEIVGSRHNPRIVAYHQTTSLRASDDETPWCASFVNWVMIEAGYRGANSARARDWLNWGEALDEPRAGAVTVIRQNQVSNDPATGSRSGFHVAFLVEATDEYVVLLGGNQRNTVRESRYPLRSYTVRGYRWPT